MGEAFDLLVEFAGSEDDAYLIILDLYKAKINDRSVQDSAGATALANLKAFFASLPPKRTRNGLQNARMLTKNLPSDMASDISTYSIRALQRKNKIGPIAMKPQKIESRKLIETFLDESAAPAKVTTVTSDEAFPFTKKYVY